MGEWPEGNIGEAIETPLETSWGAGLGILLFTDASGTTTLASDTVVTFVPDESTAADAVSIEFTAGSNYAKVTFDPDEAELDGVYLHFQTSGSWASGGSWSGGLGVNLIDGADRLAEDGSYFQATLSEDCDVNNTALFFKLDFGEWSEFVRIRLYRGVDGVQVSRFTETVTITDADPESVVAVAAYKNGQMISIDIATGAAELELTLARLAEADEIRIFTLDEDFIPTDEMGLIQYLFT